MTKLVEVPRECFRSVTNKTAPYSISNSNGSNVSSNLNSTNTPTEEHRSRGVLLTRILFTGILIVLVTILSVSIYVYIQRRNQGDKDHAEEQYYNIMDRALSSIERLASNRIAGAVAMANLAGYAVPKAEDWPMVRVDSWWSVGSQVQISGLNGGYSLAPIVTPDIQSAFEEYAQAYLEETYPGEDAGVSSFGFGIWAKNDTTNSSDTKYHHTNGYPYSYESVNGWATPKYQHTKGNHELLMMDVHGFPEQGGSIDNAYECSKKRALELDPQLMVQEYCTALSALTPPKDPLERTGPGAFVATCVFPAENKTECVAMVFAKMNIYENLDDTFPATILGIDCVVETRHSAASFRMEGGQAIYKGDTDLHDPTYDDMAQSKKLFQGSNLTDGSISYDITCYPTQEYYEEFITEPPLAAIIGGVLVVVLTCVCFFVYDFFVRRESNSKKELLKAKRQFVRFVSHEVRTPLNSVCMALTLLQEEIAESLGYDTTEIDKAIEIEDKKNVQNKDSMEKDIDEKPEIGWLKLAKEVQVNAESSVEVLNDLLNYDKVESGSLTLELTVIPIWEIIEKTVSEFRLPATSKNIKLSLDLQPMTMDTTKPDETSSTPIANTKVIGDSIRLVQVIRNLVSNALKFTPEGKAVNIKVYWKTSSEKVMENTRTFKMKTSDSLTCPPSGEIVMCVEDEGAGLSPEQLSKLFGVGVQFNANVLQAGNGSGLGLFIAKGIVEQHEGSLVCNSAGLGCGTSFTVTLPLYNVPDVVPDNTEADYEFRDTYQQTPLRILIVDDAQSNRKLLKRLLDNRGNRCHEAVDGQEALNMVKKAASDGKFYDLILLDYEMPVMNGPMAASHIRALGVGTFIVGITGNFMDEDVQHFKFCGANAVLPKPFKVQELENLCVEYHVTGSIYDSIKNGKEMAINDHQQDDDDDDHLQ